MVMPISTRQSNDAGTEAPPTSWVEVFRRAFLERGSGDAPDRGLAWLAAGLVLIHLLLVARNWSAGQLGINLICYLAVIVLLRRRKDPVVGDSGALPTLTGMALLGLLFLNSAFYRPGQKELLYLFPLLGGLSLSLLAAGFRGVRIFWKELTILFFLGVPRGFLAQWIDFAPITAQAAGFLLWYAGYDVKLTGVDLGLPGGSVIVSSDCDGTEAMTYVVCLAVVFMMLFPLRWGQRTQVALLALGASFLINAVRVAVLAVIQSTGNSHAFDFWHQGQASFLWTMLPVLVLGGFCLWLVRKPREEAAEPPDPPSE